MPFKTDAHVSIVGVLHHDISGSSGSFVARPGRFGAADGGECQGWKHSLRIMPGCSGSMNPGGWNSSRAWASSLIGERQVSHLSLAQRVQSLSPNAKADQRGPIGQLHRWILSAV